MDATDNFPHATNQRAGDSFLQLLIRMVNIAAIRFSLFLVVDGATVGGMVISRDEWVANWRAELSGAAGDPGESFANAFLAADEDGAFIYEDEVTELDLPSKIHLKDARVNGVGPMLLRVDIRSVSAWSFGNSPNRSDEGVS